MANFFPASYSEIFKQDSPLNPSSLLVSYQNFTGSLINNISVLNAPSWLVVSNILGPSNISGGSITFNIAINAVVANTMAAGVYNASLKVSYRNRIIKTTSPESFNITLTVESGNILRLAPAVLSFEYNLGEALPLNKLLQIQTDYNWNLDPTQTWITPETRSGLGNASVVIGVDPAGLTTGRYEGRIRVKDEFFQRWAAVELIVKGVDTTTDFLYPTPENLEFVTEFEKPSPKTKILSIESSGSWSAATPETWLQLSTETGTAGTTEVEVSLNNEALAVGSYTAPVTITMGDIVKTIFAQITVVSFLSEGLISETLYFAKDRNKLRVTTITDNTYLQLQTSVATGSNNVTYQQEAPYFKGVASIVVGEETEVLLKSVTPPTSLVSRIINAIKPINYGVVSQNINKITNRIDVLDSYQNLRFLKGKTPTIATKLCYVPNQITVTKDAVISLSVLATSSPGDIIITGDVTATISTSLPENLYTYTALINLSELNLTTGQNINIVFGDISTNVTIKASEPEENSIAFENEWGVYEFFNTSGFLSTTQAAKTQTTELALEGQKHTKVVSIDLGFEYVLNTGWIYSQYETEWLSKILNSKRIFIYEGTTPIEIVLTTKKLQVYKTRDYLKQFNLKFKRAIV